MKGVKLLFTQDSDDGDIGVNVRLFNPSIFKKIFFWFWSKRMCRVYQKLFFRSNVIVCIWVVNDEGKTKLLRKVEC